MPASGMFRGLGRLRTDVSEDSVASIFKVEGICERGTALAVG
jgi:hypothetical protein